MVVVAAYRFIFHSISLTQFEELAFVLVVECVIAKRCRAQVALLLGWRGLATMDWVASAFRSVDTDTYHVGWEAVGASHVGFERCLLAVVLDVDAGISLSGPASQGPCWIILFAHSDDVEADSHSISDRHLSRIRARLQLALQSHLMVLCVAPGWIEQEFLRILCLFTWRRPMLVNICMFRRLRDLRDCILHQWNQTPVSRCTWYGVM